MRGPTGFQTGTGGSCPSCMSRPLAGQERPSGRGGGNEGGELSWLSVASDLATVVLAVGAIGAYGWYQIEAIIRRRELEAFLKGQIGKRSKEDDGSRSVLFLASKLRLTENEVIEAGFRSKKIKPVPGFDKESGRADAILFMYDPEP